MATIKELLDYGMEQLANSGNEYAKFERKALLEHVLSVNYMYMIMNGDEEVPEDKANYYRKLIEKRMIHYPLQYLLGYAHFMDYTFYVDENVLIPRSDTEILVETFNDMYTDICNNFFDEKNVKLLDLCCGSGCIGISIKLYHSETKLTLSDVSDGALKVAMSNLKKYKLEDVIINKGNLFDGLKDRYSIIVCNPPYIEREIVNTLMPEVKDYEPRLALDGGEDGLSFYRSIIKEAVDYLDTNGYIFFEIGYNQGKEVSSLMKDAGFSDVIVKKDYADMDRVVIGHL